MTKRSKYATLDRRILAVCHPYARPSQSRISHSVYKVAKRAALDGFCKDGKPTQNHSGFAAWYELVKRRLQALRRAGKLKNNGRSGEACRWSRVVP